MERTKLGLSKDKMYKALGEGERTSKKVASIRMSDGSTFKRKNANQYGTAEGGNDYTEKRSNRSDRFDLGGTADSAENGGANIGGTLGSSMMKRGGGLGEEFYEGQSIIMTDKSPYYGRMNKMMKRVVSPYINKELVIDKITKSKPHNLAKVFLRSSGEKAPFDVVLNKKYIQQYANGGGLANVPETFPETDAMSYGEGGGTKGYKLTLKSWDADVYEDDYNEGEGKNVNSFNEKVNKSFSSGEELLKYISDFVLYHPLKKEDYSIMDDGRIVTSVLVDEDNSSASAREVEEWKNGNKKLYSANYNFYVTLTQEKTPSADELSKLLGISVYKNGGSVKVGDKVILPEIKMRDGKTQFEKVENGEVLSIENGIYDVLNPKTNRIHRVTLNQIKYKKGGSTVKDNRMNERTRAVILKIQKTGIHPDDVSPNFVNEIAYDNGIELKSEEVVFISDNYGKKSMANGGSTKGFVSYKTGGKVGNKTIEKRLEQLRKELRAERISYGELVELQSLAKYIDKNDVELLEAAGVPEFDEDEKHAEGGSTKGFEYTIGGL
jgi:hypothetical protein